MAFVRANFARVTSSANTSAPTVWSYNATADTQAAVVAADYFLDAINEIQVGDLLMYVSDSNAKYGTAMCNANTGTAIDFTDATVGTVTDAG